MIIDFNIVRNNISDQPPPPEDEEEIGGYDEASIRYRGGHIPSKSFKILQNMTGGPSELPPRPG